ncbi:hypothetical protein FOA43_002604 [Brettanomyces nanus]|uniref:Xylanolytic transcriptional activator regulatory domain-containing protein n=1 Tax=Eeniella nana TaxID=13502 RepID=A0A875S7Y4_EENNA|nr:uncharacterized protein FOA43_002604 [Brettanomyces nanus]QPG75254.1 hypothetical protein FOA43_002604 [Brettanomyces nanus]
MPTRPACLVCVQHNIAHLCGYRKPDWADHEKLGRRKPEEVFDLDVDEMKDVKIRKLEERIEQLEQDIRYYKNGANYMTMDEESESKCHFVPKNLSYDTDSGCITNISSLTPKGMLRSDPFYTTSLQYFKKHNNLPMDVPYMILNTNPLGESDISEEELQNVSEQTFRQRIIESLRRLQTLKISDVGRSALNAFSVPLQVQGITVPENYKEKLLERLQEVLPSEKVVGLLIERFYRYIYPIFPYLDQEAFKKNVDSVLRMPKDHTEYYQLALDSDTSFITIGLLLLVLYLGSLTLRTALNVPYTRYDENTSIENIAYMLEHPLDRKIISTARMCVDKFSVFGRCSLDLLQFYAYLRVVSQCSPSIMEPRDLGQFSDIVKRMTVSFNLNRDPSNFKNMKDNPRLANLTRKIWYGINSDNFYADYISEGFFLKCQDHGVELPVYHGIINSNCHNLDLEQVAIYTITLKSEFEAIYDRIRSKVMDLREDPKTSQVVELQDELKRLIVSRLQPLSSLLHQNENEPLSVRVKRVIQFCIYLESHSMILSLSFHLFLHYEERSLSGRFQDIELAFKYQKRNLELSLNLQYLVYHMVDQISSYFGSGFDYLVAPNLICALDSSRPILMGLLSRVILYQILGTHDDTLSKVMSESLESLLKKVEESHKDLIESYKKLAHSYYHAWRLSKVETFKYVEFKDLRKDWEKSAEKVAPFVPKMSENVMSRWTGDHMEQLVEIFETSKKAGNSRQIKEIPETLFTQNSAFPADMRDEDWIATFFGCGQDERTINASTGPTELPDLVSGTEWDEILKNIVDDQI